MYSETKRVEYLDSVRGLAALFVLLSHAVGAFDWPAAYTAPARWPFFSILFSGKEAVCMFFVLSGYVLSKPYVTAPEGAAPRKIFLPTFYLRRFTRIWLPWFFAFLASIFARKFLFFRPPTNPSGGWQASLWHAPLTAGDFFRQCIFTLHDGTRQLLIQDWSLGVELRGSVLIPLFCVLAGGKRTFVLLALAGAFLVFKMGYCYDSFIIGVLLARYGGRVVPRLARTGWPAKALFLVLGLSLYQTVDLLVRLSLDSRSLYNCGWLASSLGCAIVILSAFGSRRLQRWLGSRPLVFLGRISYSVYLVQFIIILCLLPPLVRLANLWGFGPGPGLFAMTVLAAAAATVGCAAVTYRLVEVPAINLGHWLTKELQRRWRKPSVESAANRSG